MHLSDLMFFAFLAYRDKPVMVDFKVGLTNGVTHATHFGNSPHLFAASVTRLCLFTYADTVSFSHVCRIGAVLKLIGGDAFIDKIALRQFLLSCQSKYGGFSKYPGALPDLYHSYYGYTAFSFLEEPGLSPLCHELGLPLLTALGI
ncbi:hypothetical protein F2Q69_00010883 [Brassica cretica]|uniref:Prenyltransferase alpha-alpha toroid domain-containing protein n=1 Tax=Brassica cretica TaxID=69181 RepID=A0A8S9R1A4_BRACR|nr:hypothetical protein F2Q69_00010883 [Brassica cretica]